MVLPASDVVLPSTNNGAPEADEIYDEVNDFRMSIENLEESEFSALEKPNSLVYKDNLQKEKQISVDPISLMREASSGLVLPPVITTPKVTNMHLPLPPLLPAKSKFLSSSLPSSAISSPRFTSTLLKKKLRNQSQASPRPINSLARQHSVVQFHHSQQQESHFRRSKSCGEGRACAPSDEFDLWLNQANGTEQDNLHCIGFSKSEANAQSHKSGGKETDPYDEGFKCGALCLFLPGFGKGKPVRPRKEEAKMENVISRTVSLEKFECGSWTSSAIINGNEEDGDSVNLYFDLPLELIQSSANDANSPVTAAFVFDKERKGVLKNSTARATARKSHESSRHVRFSTSSSTSHPASPSSCITPRLRKAREDFNAYLEAQSA